MAWERQVGDLLARFEASLLPHEVWLIGQVPLSVMEEWRERPALPPGITAHAVLDQEACRRRAEAHSWLGRSCYNLRQVKPGAMLWEEGFGPLLRMARGEMAHGGCQRFAAFVIMLHKLAGPAVLPYAAALFAAAQLHPAGGRRAGLDPDDLSDMAALHGCFVDVEIVT